MAKTVVIDELHVTVRVPNDLPDSQTEAIRRTMAGDEFMNRLRRAIRNVVRAYPEPTVFRSGIHLVWVWERNTAVRSESEHGIDPPFF